MLSVEAPKLSVSKFRSKSKLDNEFFIGPKEKVALSRTFRPFKCSRLKVYRILKSFTRLIWAIRSVLKRK